MNRPTLEELDKIRNLGFRPQVVGCFLYDKKILFLFDKEYSLWQLPQGGIDNNETVDYAFTREMTEELGQKFMKSVANQVTKLNIVCKDKIEFPSSTQNTRELQNDKGDKLFMKGKIYFFVAVGSSIKDLDINETEFDDYKWVDFNEANALTDEIYQRGKKRITANVLGTLKFLKFL